MTQKPSIDLDAIVSVAHKGARRAYAFLGLGVNAANSDAVSSVHLPLLFQMRLLPENVTPDQLRHIKEEFEIWIVANALRELLDVFSIFIDEIYKVAVIISLKEPGKPGDEITALNKFSRMSVAEKLEGLASSFQIKTSKADSFPSLKNARNCLVHRLGIVGTQDVGDDGNLHLKWYAFQVAGRLPTGSLEIIPPDQVGPITFTQPATIEMSQVVRTKTFAIGQNLKLTPRELGEVVWTVFAVVDEIKNATVDLARRMGRFEEKAKALKINTL